MLLGYLDESYSADWYYMAALLCDGTGAQAITTALDDVIIKAVKSHGVAEDAELHGYELFQGEGWWQDLAPRARLGVYNDAFQAIGQHARAIILRGVHSAGLRQRYLTPEPPHSIVLLHLLERIDDYARSQGEHVLVIADEVGEQAKHRSDMAMYRRSGTWGYRAKRLTQIVDTLHFAPSSASRLVQAIDLVTFLYRRMECHTETTLRATRANDNLWARIEPKVRHRQCWHPVAQQQR
ncbi:DUF3800 domain-containing protein [Micromonospora sp. WMMD1128]|uniref:DUF3800 domain-containing protein n=1 Tax=Micromonospora sp. WMMD1128 TaxID=3015150 RepID=UPI00248CFAE0|nr:DUF3800 domain-containing protein [Micromonospora sp. WMMD1128]WBB73175.1 DUF3800 domain-containing protein [Micromonospora sp. WMMD1128]